MKIGNWDGGPGQRILLPLGVDAEAGKRARPREVVALMRDAGFDCHLTGDGGKKS